MWSEEPSLAELIIYTPTCCNEAVNRFTASQPQATILHYNQPNRVIIKISLSVANISGAVQCNFALWRNSQHCILSFPISGRVAAITYKVFVCHGCNKPRNRKAEYAMLCNGFGIRAQIYIPLAITMTMSMTINPDNKCTWT